MAKFYLPTETKAQQGQCEEQERSLSLLVATWDMFDKRSDTFDREWIEDLTRYLDGLANDRVEHVHEWLQANTIRFKTDSPQFEDVRRLMDSLVVSLRTNIRLCALQCAECQLLCLRPKHHDGEHDCSTTHSCTRLCQYDEEHESNPEHCGLPCVPFRSWLFMH